MMRTYYRTLMIYLMILVPLSMMYADTNFFISRSLVVILDAGHGGDDPGAVGVITRSEPQQVLEKEINLAIAERVRDSLQAIVPQNGYSPIDVLMTREGDEDVSLWRRAVLANQAEIDEDQRKIFVSIHTNAAPVGINASGFEIWRFTPHVDREVIISGVNDSAIEHLAKKSNREVNQELRVAEFQLATAMKESMETELTAVFGTRSRGIKDSRYYVLEYTFMPSILIEVGFISDPDEIMLLLDGDYQQHIADAIANAIYHFMQH